VQRVQCVQRAFLVEGKRPRDQTREKRRVLLPCVVALAIGGCGAHWSRRDVVLEASSAAVNLVDAHQSLAIAAAGAENNRIIGPRGDRTGVWTFALTAAVLHVLATDSLPASWRAAWQGASIGFESGVVVDNWRKGWAP
jgi:hypothetical protein